MLNKTQLQANNNALEALITRVNAAKDTAASLPEAGNGQDEMINFTLSYGMDGSQITTVQAQAFKNMNFAGWFHSELNSKVPLTVNISGGVGDGFNFSGSTDIINYITAAGMSALINVATGIGQTPRDFIEENAIYSAILPNVSACCFDAGTQILTSLDGSTTNIENLKPGDAVVSYNIDTNQNYIAQVHKLITHENTVDLAEIITEDGRQVLMNAYHPLYTTSGWKSLTNYNGYETLQVTDCLKTPDGWVAIKTINRYISEPITTYNIDVIDIDEIPDNEIHDNFYANGILAHNGFC